VRDETVPGRSSLRSEREIHPAQNSDRAATAAELRAGPDDPEQGDDNAAGDQDRLRARRHSLETGRGSSKYITFTMRM
jgi:hypothetical protein